MGFKIKMAEVSNDDLKKIRDDRPSGRYDGPTPPPGHYDVKVKKMWFAETKAGKPALKVALGFHNEGEEAIYNGYSYIENYMIPVDNTDRAFPIQVSQIDSLFDALSKGKMSFIDFHKAVNEGRTDASTDKKDKVGLPVTQIGSLKITGDQIIRVKTKLREYNGEEFVETHYIVREERSNVTADDDLDTSDFADDIDDDDDLDALLGE